MQKGGMGNGAGAEESSNGKIRMHGDCSLYPLRV